MGKAAHPVAGRRWSALAGTQKGFQHMTSQGPLEQAYREAKAGRLSRRGFLERAMALGVGLPVAAVLANSVTFQGAAAQDATPAATQGRPSIGTENQERGAGGELRLIQWQAVSTL